jgi:hypothetical protein
MTYVIKETQLLLAPAMYISGAAVLWILALTFFSAKDQKQANK